MVPTEENFMDIENDLNLLVAWLNANRPNLAEYSVFSVGSSMAKIVHSGGGSVHCFVAMADNCTRALGMVRKGEIFKPADWKAPAKHARGDLFDIKSWSNAFGDYGVRYLK